jgi:hypothetical protein
VKDHGDDVGTERGERNAIRQRGRGVRVELLGDGQDLTLLRPSRIVEMVDGVDGALGCRDGDEE